jgi:hypothetical protein
LAQPPPQVRAYKMLGMGSNEWLRFVQEMRRKAAFSHFSSAPASRFFTSPSNLAPRRPLDCVPARRDLDFQASGMTSDCFLDSDR